MIGYFSKLLLVLKNKQEDLQYIPQNPRKSISLFTDHPELIDQTPLRIIKKCINEIETNLENGIKNCRETIDKLTDLLQSDRLSSWSEASDISVEQMKNKLAELFPDAARQIPQTLENMAKVKIILMNQTYCDNIMQELQEEMKKKSKSITR